MQEERSKKKRDSMRWDEDGHRRENNSARGLNGSSSLGQGRSKIHGQVARRDQPTDREDGEIWFKPTASDEDDVNERNRMKTDLGA